MATEDIRRAAALIQAQYDGIDPKYLRNAEVAGSYIRQSLQPYAEQQGIAVEDVINYLFERTAYGGYSYAMGSTFKGFNHRNVALPIPINRDTNGLVFFTRPDLNLTEWNLRNYRVMNPLRNTDTASVACAIRCTLDPDLMEPNTADNPDRTPITCDLIDNKQVFIPLLTNTCVSVSGFEDLHLPSYTTKPGAYGETMAWADGHTKKLGVYDISTTFRNMAGSPILQMLYYWMEYAAAVRQGIIKPKIENVVKHRIDYQTAIYRVILDHSKRWVENIARTGFSQPSYIPFGAVFNYEHDKPFNEANNQITVTWTGHGQFFQDDLIIRTFNASVVLRNPDMADNRRASQYTLIPYDMVDVFNHRGYPRIDPATREMQWWIGKEEFNLMTGRNDKASALVPISGYKNTVIV